MTTRANITITPATAADLPDIYNMVKGLAKYEKAENEVSCTLDRYHQLFEEKLFDAILARIDGSTVVGMAVYYPSFSTWKGKMMYLEDFYVLPEYRQHGIGAKIFEAFLDIAKSENCTLVKWQVLDWNKPALHFYEKMNATIEKEWWNGKIFLGQ